MHGQVICLHLVFYRIGSISRQVNHIFNRSKHFISQESLSGIDKMFWNNSNLARIFDTPDKVIFLIEFNSRNPF